MPFDPHSHLHFDNINWNNYAATISSRILDTASDHQGVTRSIKRQQWVLCSTSHFLNIWTPYSGTALMITGTAYKHHTITTVSQQNFSVYFAMHNIESQHTNTNQQSQFIKEQNQFSPNESLAPISNSAVLKKHASSHPSPTTTSHPMTPLMVWTLPAV